MIKEYIKGNLLDTHIENIAQGVNAQNVMGSGVAKAIFTKYPQVKEDYHIYMSTHIPLAINGNEDFLGTVQPVVVGDDKVVFNCWTQEYFGRDGKQYVDYNAVRECFEHLTNGYDITEIAIPKIGCGLAGGDWDIVSNIIDEETGDKLDVYVYCL